MAQRGLTPTLENTPRIGAGTRFASLSYNLGIVAAGLLPVGLLLVLAFGRPASFILLISLVLGLAAIAAGVVARVLVRKETGHHRRQANQGMLWGAIPAFGIIALVFVLLMGPRGPHDRSVINCASHLRQITIALHQYAIDDLENQAFPDSLEVLSDYLDARVLACPVSHHSRPAPGQPLVLGQNLSYIYLGSGLTRAVDPQTALVIELPGHHAEDQWAIGVVFADSKVMHIPANEAAALLRQAAEQGRLPPEAVELLFLKAHRRPD